MKKRKQPERDLSYLEGMGADAPQTEDIKSVIRPLEYRELEGEIENEIDLIRSLATHEGSLEVKKDEFVILERKIKSELPGFDFYIARRQKAGKVFEPETVLIAKRNKEHYIQKLNTEISKQYDALDEQGKLLTQDESRLMKVAGDSKRTLSGSHFVTQGGGNGEIDNLGQGGFSTVRPAVLRKKGKFVPKGVAVKETSGKMREMENVVSEQEVLSLVKKLKEIIPNAWEYLAEPMDSVEGDEHSGVWELLSSTGGKDFTVEDIEHKFEREEKIPFEKKLTIIRQLFEALETTSKLGLFHNDIKPANILLTPKGIKLCDFGLLHFSKKMMDPSLVKKAVNLPESFHGIKPKDGVVNGTLFYIHPRIISQSFPEEKYNPRYDVYSAGLTAVEILTDGDVRPDKLPLLPSDWRIFYDKPDKYIKEIIKLLRERFNKDMADSSFDKKAANQLIELLEKSLRDGLGVEYDEGGSPVVDEKLSVQAKKEMQTPIEDLLPSPFAFVEVLKKMGVKESF